MKKSVFTIYMILFLAVGYFCGYQGAKGNFFKLGFEKGAKYGDLFHDDELTIDTYRIGYMKGFENAIFTYPAYKHNYNYDIIDISKMCEWEIGMFCEKNDLDKCQIGM